MWFAHVGVVGMCKYGLRRQTYRCSLHTAGLINLCADLIRTVNEPLVAVINYKRSLLKVKHFTSVYELS